MVPPPRARLCDLASWVPADIVEWMGKVEGTYPVVLWNRYVRLLTDDRMRSVWEWHSTARNSATLELYRSSLTLLMAVDRAIAFPKKPGNMTKAKRDAYFDKVRLHAYALLQLIEDTKFSSNSEHWQGTSNQAHRSRKAQFCCGSGLGRLGRRRTRAHRGLLRERGWRRKVTLDVPRFSPLRSLDGPHRLDALGRWLEQLDHFKRAHKSRQLRQTPA